MPAINNTMIGKVIGFQVYPSAILTDDFSDVKLIGFVNYEGVASWISPAVLHATVYPTLPEGVPNDYRAYEYVLLRKQDNTVAALGLPWIKEDTVTVSDSVELIVTIRGKSISDINNLRQVLTSNNFTDIDININANV